LQNVNVQLCAFTTVNFTTVFFNLKWLGMHWIPIWSWIQIQLDIWWIQFVFGSSQIQNNWIWLGCASGQILFLPVTLNIECRTILGFKHVTTDMNNWTWNKD